MSDRLVRRDSSSRPLRWRLGHLLALETSQVETLVSADFRAQALSRGAPSERSLLTTPYFLNAFLQGGTLATTITDQMHQYFLNHALSDVDLDRAAEAAFRFYANSARPFLARRVQIDRWRFNCKSIVGFWGHSE